MPAARESSAPLPIEVSLARIISHGLVPATAASDVVAAVSIRGYKDSYKRCAH